MFGKQFKTQLIASLVLFAMAAGCSEKMSSPPPRPAPDGSEVTDPTESVARFEDESDFAEENFIADEDRLPPDLRGIQIRGPEESTPETGPLVTEEIQETLIEPAPLPRQPEHPVNLQSTMKDVKLPEVVFAQNTIHLHPSYSTGAKMNEELYYTDGSSDGLISYLRATLRSAEDQAFSGSLHGVQIHDLDRQTGSHTLSFSIRGSSQNQTFTGAADAHGVLSYSPDGSTDSGLSVKGICLDYYDHCHNLLIRVQKDEGGGLRTGFIVYRRTPGSVVLEGFSGYAAGSPMDRWSTFIRNTEIHRTSIDAGRGETSLVNRMQYFSFRTTAVVFGESRFDTEMEVLRPNLCSELILVNGPLVKSFDRNEFRLPLSQPRTEFISRNGATAEDLGLFMGELNRGALINNNGLGDLRVAVNVSNAAGVDDLRLTYERKHVRTDLDRACYLHPLENLCVTRVDVLTERPADPLER